MTADTQRREGGRGGGGNRGGGQDRVKTSFGGVDGTVRARTWMAEGISQEAVAFAEAFGKHLNQKRFKTSQIRKVFGEVRRLEMRGYNEAAFLMLKPRLAYLRREGSSEAEAFSRVLSAAIDAVVEGSTEAEKHKRFKTFIDFFEAILAYHRAFGGK